MSSSNRGSSSGSNSNSSNNSSSGGSAYKSDSRVVKDAGFDNMPHFMASHGLKMSSGDDYAEAKAIIDGYRRIRDPNLKYLSECNYCG
ncbi:hypothetical protein VTN00DRAFT_6655 [Thermoascus crustaceus]|uniref:uncharacterized protein n=1 Tax=Thermoascus crustaceus TaxID=5088 RepID=UPI003743BE62